MNGGGRDWLVILGAVGFVVLLGLFVAGREVSAAWLALVGGMMGLAPLLGWAGRK